MSVVPRKRATRTVFYVVTTWRGRRYWELSGADRQVAERLSARRKREATAGTFQPKQSSPRTLVCSFGEAWIEKRKARWSDGNAYLRRIVLEHPRLGQMHIEDVRKKHAFDLLDELRAQARYSEKTIANILGMARTMFQAAVDREIIASNPFSLPRGTLDRSPSTPRESYPLAEVLSLMSAESAHPSARMFAALALMTGMREGEVAGRRWRDWDGACKPLGALRVASQYIDQPLKTAKRAGLQARLVPIHPQLARMLAWWWSDGWQMVHLREPKPDDFIVPRRGAKCHTKSSAYKLWRHLCADAGVANRSMHSTRHTFISMCRRGGAMPDVVERITHNAKGNILDQYTHWEWAPLCEAVLRLQLGEAPVMSPVLTPDIVMPLLSDRSGVEAPGIEPGSHRATRGNDTKHESTIGAPVSAEPPGIPLGGGSERAAGQRGRHVPLPSLLTACRGALAAVYGGRAPEGT